MEKRLPLSDQLLKTALSVLMALLIAFVTREASAGVTNQCSIYDEGKGPPGRGPASQSEDNGAIVIPLDRGVSVESLRRQGYRVKTYEQFNATNPWRDPSPSLRDLVIARASLTDYVREWDELDKDLLFLRAQEQKLPFLKRKYPKIPHGLLAGLQRVIAKLKADERRAAE